MRRVALLLFATVSGLSAQLYFTPVTPCRVVDTRPGQGTSGAFGPPALAAGQARDFPLPQGRCNLPANAQAYSLNITVVPKGYLGFVSLWPAGNPPQGDLVSTLNSYDGSVVANAAIVGAGTGGAITVFASDLSDIVIDLNGYFASNGGVFYPLYACRAADTRTTASAPALSPGVSRDFLMFSGACPIPPAATAIALNATVVPAGGLGFLTLWPTGQARPLASTLNSPGGRILANAAIVPLGQNGGVSAYATDRTELVLDASGYFAPAGSPGGALFYPMRPCRILDTRKTHFPLAGGTAQSVAMNQLACGIPANAQAYSLNITAVPQTRFLGYLTVWPYLLPQPTVSTLNSTDGRVVSNAAIAVSGILSKILLYATDTTDVIVDVNGYFLPVQ